MPARSAHIDTFTHDNLPPRSTWPEFLFDLPELRYPPVLNCAEALLDRRVLEGGGDRRCIVTDDLTWTYRDLLERAQQVANVLAGELGLVSLLALVWSGTGLFGSLEFAINRVYGFRGRNPLVQRLVGLRLIGVFALAILIAVALNVAISFVDLPFFSISAYLAALAGWLVIVIMLLAIYRLAPARVLPLGELLPGALVAGALVELATLAFPLINVATHRYSTYAKGFAFVFLLTTWLYLRSSLILLGAVMNRLLAGREVPVPEDAPVGPVLEQRKGRRAEAQARREDHRPSEEGGPERAQDVAAGQG